MKCEGAWTRVLVVVVSGALAVACASAAEGPTLPNEIADAGGVEVEDERADSGAVGRTDAWSVTPAPEAPSDAAGGEEAFEPQPCETNEDCFSGFCVPTPDGDMCTETCVEECPQGWDCKAVSTGSDLTYICVYLALTHCDPCMSDADCEHPLVKDQGARCVADDPAQGAFCRFPCDDGPCPEGSSCEERDVDGVTLNLCVPDSGECTCSESAKQSNASTACVNEGGLGSCEGSRSCGPDGLSQCDALIASAEVCDGLDNDCDGLVDGNDPDLVAMPCATQAGVCAGSESISCVDGQWALCDALAYGSHSDDYEESESRCDGLDNDCDGLVDEGFSLELPDGSIIEGVGAPCGLGACEGGVSACDSAGEGLVCLSGEAAPELCNGLDDDCDGLTDAEDDDLVLAPCGLQGGLCQGAMSPANLCEDGAWSECSPEDYLAHAPGYQAEAELSCDGLDEDCDGATDEDFTWEDPQGGLILGAGQACGLGVCAGGLTECSALGDGLTCSSDALMAADTTCDGIDQDCDGVADDDYAPTDTTCGQGACAATGLMVCIDGALQDTCVSAEAPEGDATCDGVDDDCDGETDEDYVPLETSCGVGACGALGTLVCADGGVLNDTCVALEPSTLDDTCDGVDDDCDGSTDEHYVASQTTCGEGACAASGVKVCTSGVEVDSCVAGDPLGADADCDGNDDDCDGDVDEAYEPTLTTCGVGACQAQGLALCEDGQTLDTCEALAAAGVDANCDGVDDDCDGSTDEHYQPSQTTCGEGACAATGLLLCDEGAETNSCVVAPATGDDSDCDGVDDDCDGETDEAYLPLLTTCGLGACKADGLLTCQGGVATDTCEELTPGDNDDDCDGVDDDCDGATDEGYEATISTCGVGACAAQGVLDCSEGELSDSCTPGQALEDDALCDGLDSDCDGETDEDYVEIVTTCGLGACVGTGTLSCAEGGDEVDDCSVDLSLATPETCDGVDEDCDGLTDEGPDGASLVLSCYSGPEGTEGVGECQAGAQICVDSELGACLGEALPTDEVCDGLDNDCSGATDEGFSDLDDDGEADCVDEDMDGDGVPNEADNCVEVPNPEQLDGDGDDIGDVCDAWSCGIAPPAGAIIVTTLLDGFVNDGECSLREAIEASNTDSGVDGCMAGSGADVILFEKLDGVLVLTESGADEDDNKSGDLDILGGVTIQGCGADKTVLDGGSLDRVLHIHPGASLKLVDMSIQGGRATGSAGGLPGGGQAPGFGGAIYNASELLSEGVVFRNNEALGGLGAQGGHAPGAGGGGGGGGGLGGALYNGPGAVSVISPGAGGCAFQDNIALGGDGGRGMHHGQTSPYTGFGGGGGGASGGSGGNASAGAGGGFGGGGGGGGGASGGSPGGAGGFGGGGGGGGGSVWGGNSGSGGNAGFGGGGGGVGCCSGAGGGGGGAGLGGALFNDGGIVNIASCLMSGNQALGGLQGNGFYSGAGAAGGGYGGAIFERGGGVDAIELIYEDNVAASEGDDVYSGAP